MTTEQTAEDTADPTWRAELMAKLQKRCPASYILFQDIVKSQCKKISKLEKHRAELDAENETLWRENDELTAQIIKKDKKYNLLLYEYSELTKMTLKIRNSVEILDKQKKNGFYVSDEAFNDLTRPLMEDLTGKNRVVVIPRNGEEFILIRRENFEPYSISRQIHTREIIKDIASKRRRKQQADTKNAKYDKIKQALRNATELNKRLTAEIAKQKRDREATITKIRQDKNTYKRTAEQMAVYAEYFEKIAEYQRITEQIQSICEQATGRRTNPRNGIYNNFYDLQCLPECDTLIFKHFGKTTAEFARDFEALRQERNIICHPTMSQTSKQ